MAGRATIVGIAQELGLSKSTVSDALNGTGRVAPETTKLVRETAQRLGYVTNRAARSLRTHRVGAVGLFIPPVARSLAFYMEFAFGVARRAAAAGADLTLLVRDPDAAGWAPQVDGVIAIDPSPADPTVAALLRAGIPTVTVGRYLGPGEDAVRGVLEARHLQLEVAALDNLRRRGRKRPALIAVDDVFSSSWAVDTRQAYTDWCLDHGIPPVVKEISAVMQPSDLIAVVTEAVEDAQVDALVCGGQGLAAQAQLILEQRGVVIGQDVDLVSVAGAAPTETENTALTVIDLAPATYGAAAADLLLDVLNDNPGHSLVRWFDGAQIRFAT